MHINIVFSNTLLLILASQYYYLARNLKIPKETADHDDMMTCFGTENLPKIGRGGGGGCGNVNKIVSVFYTRCFLCGFVMLLEDEIGKHLLRPVGKLRI